MFESKPAVSVTRISARETKLQNSFIESETYENKGRPNQQVVDLTA